MLREYSKINHPIRTAKTGRIVLWKGKEKALYYSKRLFVDCAAHFLKMSVW